VPAQPFLGWGEATAEPFGEVDPLGALFDFERKRPTPSQYFGLVFDLADGAYRVTGARAGVILRSQTFCCHLNLSSGTAIAPSLFFRRGPG
jgi:hypothetical protein